jgi:chromosomal replication initiation ATPase DnaA
MKRDFSPTTGYKTWLREVANHYEVKQSEITGSSRKPEVVVARQTFLWLCWRDGIKLPALSRKLGKDRSTFDAIMNQGHKNRERNIENQLYEKVTTQKDLAKTKRETKAGERGVRENVEISGRLVFNAAPRR